MAKRQSGKPNKTMTEVSASVAKLKAEFQDIIKAINRVKKEGETSRDVYEQQSEEIKKQLGLLEKEMKALDVIKKSLKDKVESSKIDSKQRADLTKALNKAVSLEKTLGRTKNEFATELSKQLLYQKQLEDEALKVKKIKAAEDEEANQRASVLGEIQNRLKKEGIEITQREKEEQQLLRDQIKEGNARRTEEVKAFESRRKDFANKRKARLKEIGQLEKKQEQDRIAAAKTQMDIDLKMSNRGKMTLEQRRDLQKKIVSDFRKNYDQQSNDYKKLTLKLIKIDESFEKKIIDRDKNVQKSREGAAKKELESQKRLDKARRNIFKLETELSKKSAKEKLKDVETYYKSALRNTALFSGKESEEYKKLYAELLGLRKKYNRQVESEDKANATTPSETATKKKGGFLEGVRSGFDGGAIGKAVGRLTGIGGVIQTLRKTFRLLQKAITDSFKAAVDFEAQLAQLQAVTGISNAELKQLEKSVLDVAGSTKFTSEEIVELQTELGKLGFSVNEIEEATLAVARTAQALGEKVGPVAQRIGQILNQFNLDAVETVRVSDSLVSVINSSALSFEGFSTALQYIGPLGAEVGTTFEETSVAMALLADNGFTASRVGTGLRGILTELSTTGKDLFTVVDELAEKEISLSEAVDLVGKRNAAQLITLVDAAREQRALGKSLDDLSDKYFNQGSSAIAAAQQVDTFQGNLDLLKSAVNRVQIAFGNLLKTSKFLRIALKFIDEEGYDAAVAAESIAAADPKVFSDGLEKAAERVGKLKEALVDVKEIEGIERAEATKLAEKIVIGSLEKQIELVKEKKAEEIKSLEIEKKRLEAEKVFAKTRAERDQAGVKLIAVKDQLIRLDQKNAGYQSEINDLQDQINDKKEEGFTAEIDYIQQLISEGGTQNALELTRNQIIAQREELIDGMQNARDNDVKNLKQANDFNDLIIEKEAEIQAQIDVNTEKRKKASEEEKLLLNAKISQLEQQKSTIAAMRFTEEERSNLAQKEFELEFKRLANRIKEREAQLEQEQAILDVQIKTQQNLAKNAATEKEREEAAKKLAELQIQRAKNEKAAYEDLSAEADKYQKILEDIGKEIKRAELDDRFLKKAEARLKSFRLGFENLNIDITDLAESVGKLAVTLGDTFKKKLSKGIALDDKDMAVVDTSLTNLIKGMGIAEDSEEFDELFGELKPLLMSYLIPDPESEIVEKRKKLLEKILAKLADAIKQYNQTALENTQNRLDQELDSIRNRYQVESDILKAQLNNQLITESQFRTKQLELRKAQIAEENSINEKKFKAQQKADLINVGIETAAALASNILNNFKSFDTLSATGLTAAGNLVILAAGAAKADAIRRKQFFPAKFEEGGMVQGPSHAQGGVPFTVQGRGGYEMEGGEFIVNKKAASLHRGLLEKINSSYKVPTTASAYKFASGGMVGAKADESVDYLKAIAEATTSSAIQARKPVRAFVSSKDLRSNETERRLRDRNDRI